MTPLHFETFCQDVGPFIQCINHEWALWCLGLPFTIIRALHSAVRPIHLQFEILLLLTHYFILVTNTVQNKEFCAKRSAGVAPEVNIREHISCMPLPCVNKALKPRGDITITRSPRQGYQWPQKRTYVLQKFKNKGFPSFLVKYTVHILLQLYPKDQ